MSEIPPPIPDPTILTTQQIDRGLAAERDYVNAQLDVLRQRFSDTDRATQVLEETVNRLPTDVQTAVLHVRELADEKHASIAQQFHERDIRSERESRDNKVAVEAAFAAQKEAAHEQNKSNTLAIDKSERATAETLNKQADLFRSATDALHAQIADLKERVAQAEAIKAGGQENRSNLYATIGVSVTLILAALSVVGFVIANSP